MTTRAAQSVMFVSLSSPKIHNNYSIIIREKDGLTEIGREKSFLFFESQSAAIQ